MLMLHCDIMDAPKQITLRDVSPDLSQRLKAVAEASGTSLNRTILNLLEGALGVEAKRRGLQERYETWSEQAFQEFEEALQAQRTIDSDLWR